MQADRGLRSLLAERLSGRWAKAQGLVRLLAGFAGLLHEFTDLLARCNAFRPRITRIWFVSFAPNQAHIAAQMTADVVYSSYPLRAVCHQRHFDRNVVLLRFSGHLRMSAAMRMEVFHGNKEKLSAVDLHLILTQGGCGQNLGLLGGSPCIHMRSAYGR